MRGLTDCFSPDVRSRTMASVKAKDTSLEMRVRKAFHAAGFRYRLHDARLPGKPDIVLPKYRTVVFVHGCFWHSHGCRRSALPEANKDYWEGKIARNRLRDAAAVEALTQAGWHVRIIWECQLAQDLEKIVAFLSGLRKAGGQGPNSQRS